ncbi:MAG TPA: DegT/DnrJ/EryC1/StrS family aminotransferase, partial [Campylobacterales bacterium]|nr:DegT/DnrJ/EryC1/StrS family aminotransferase [Campylobacterales bacterium]
YIGGERVKKFEADFAAYIGAKHCIGVGNGTDALEIILSSLGLPKGSKVIVPANSFIATSEAVTNAGFEVIFADVKEDYTIKLEMVEGVKAVICVHLYGLPCDMDEITAFCAKHSLALIEDCAQAHGAQYKGQKVGTFGNAASFSFYPGKNLGAYGDGGAITTNDDALAKKMRMTANHGRTGKYDHEFEGRNSRLDGLQAAVLGVKLPHLDSWLERRNSIAGVYLRELAGTPLELPRAYDDRRHVWHLFVIRTDRRDELKEFLASHGVESGIHYPIALPKLAAYSYVRQDTGGFFACRTDKELLSLPIGEHLTESDAMSVCEKIKQFFGVAK